MSQGLKYCVHCCEAIQSIENTCVHCGQKQRVSSISNKLSAVLLMGFVIPACQKQGEQPKVVDPSPIEIVDGEEAVDVPDNKAEEKEILLPFTADARIQSLYGVAPIPQVLKFSVALSLEVDGKKTIEDRTLEEKLQRKQPALEACYSQKWRPGVSYPDEIEVGIQVEAGKVSSVSIEGSEKETTLGECLKAEIESWEFSAETSKSLSLKLKRHIL